MEREERVKLIKDSELYMELSKLTNDMAEHKVRMSGGFSVNEILLGNEARYKKAIMSGGFSVNGILLGNEARYKKAMEMEALNKKIMADLKESINRILIELSERKK